MASDTRTSAGHGVSLKAAHYGDILQRRLPVEWVEAVTENFLDRGGRPTAVLEHVRRDAHVILHGVSMSLGGFDPLDPTYFASLRRLAGRIEASFVSDHLCFGSVDGVHGHDLWPIPLTEEALAHLIRRVLQAQELLARPLVIENVSAYVAFSQSHIPEGEFIAALLDATDAGLLLDVNNVHVSAVNLGLDPRAYIDAIPRDRVRYIHLAGHADHGTHLIDNHGAPVAEPVWRLYEHALRRFGPTPSIVEWDSHLPTLDGLLAESERARARARALVGASAA